MAKDEKDQAIAEDEELEESSSSSSSDSSSSEDDDDDVSFVEDPTYDLDYKGDCAYEAKVSVPVANITNEADKLYDELKDDAEIPGFRPGKAPRKLVENKFGKHVQNEVKGKLIAGSFRHIVEEEDLKPMSMPNVDGIEDLECVSDKPFDFTMNFEVMPKVTLGDIKKISVERPTVTVKAKDVTEQIDNMREQQGNYEPLEKGKGKDGDQIVIDFEGKIDGEPFEGGSAENYPYILGTKRFFPEFEEALEGCQTGKDITVDVPMPENIPNPDVAGKTATFTIKVHEIKRKTLPKADDEFAQSVGYEDLKDMKAKIKENLEASVNTQGNEVARTRAIEALAEVSEFEIPKTMIDAASDDVFRDSMQRLAQQGLARKEIEERLETLREEAREDAAKQIKGIVALNAFAEEREVDVTEEDMQADIAAMAAQYGMETASIAQYFAQEENRSTMEDRIYRRKATDILLSEIKVKDVELKDEDEEDDKDKDE